MNPIASVLAALALTGSFAAHAQEPWPTKPVRMVVPFAPGGATDVAARMIAQKLTENLGKQVFVENRAGANGSIGGEAAARSPFPFRAFAGEDAPA